MKIADDTFLGNSECEWAKRIVLQMTLFIGYSRHEQVNSTVIHANTYELQKCVQYMLSSTNA